MINKPRRTSLRTKILQRLLVLGVIPALVMTTAVILFLNTSRRQSIEEIEQRLAVQKASEIDRFIEEDTVEIFKIIVPYEEDTMIRLGIDERVQECATYSPVCDDQRFILEGLLATNRELMEAAFINALPLKNPKPGAETKRASRLADIPTDCVLPYRESGLLPCDFLVDYSGTPLFQAVSEGKNYIGPVYETPLGSMVTIAAPVRNKKGTVIAVIRGELKLTKVDRFIAASRLGGTGYVYVVDSLGRVIAHSLSTFDAQDSSFRDLAIVQDGMRGIGHSGPGGILTYHGTGGTTVLASSEPIRSAGWTVIVEWPYEDAFSGIYALLNQIFLFIVLILVAVIVFSMVLASDITRPIMLLKVAASRIGKREFGYPILVKTRDELEDLADSLKGMAQDLAHLEELREAQVRAEALEQALAREQKLSREKDVFLKTASHQLRTPVSAINWFIEVVRDIKAPKEVKDHLEGIYTHSQQLTAIVNDLINTGSFGIGYEVESRGPVDLKTALGEALDMFHTELKRKEIELSIFKPDEALTIHGSYGAIRTLLENLLANAITYTRVKGKITVTLSQKDNGALLIFEDNGIGIPEKEHQYIFSQFFRASNAIEEKNVGTGLGLFIVHNVVGGHGGKIWFTSELGKGTTFQVWLPFIPPVLKKP